jgi:hypothetical protein
MDQKIDQTKKRIDKAIEIKQAIQKLNIIEDNYQELKDFSVILNQWVRDGKYCEGKIKIPDLDRKIVYQLATPKFTVVKLSKI